MIDRQLGLLFFLSATLFAVALNTHAQTLRDEQLAGPDRRETPQSSRRHLLGDWDGKRTRLQKRGVDLDLQYVSDSLSNLKSEQKQRLASWNRFRGTVDIDLGDLVHRPGLYFHATALWQAGGNLGTYLGLLAGPSGMASQNTFRIDSWWVEQRWRSDRITARLGQFAGQDFYGAQHYGASFVFEPMGYALGNLFTTREVFDPPSTPAFELRLAPAHNLYVKSMVHAGVSAPFSQNPTGLVLQFHGTPVTLSEIGFTPGGKSSAVRAFDSVDSRRGYSGLYRLGAAYNPGRFTAPATSGSESGNYLLYWMANQALWRIDPEEAKGLDATVACDWSPARLNRNHTQITAGFRFNEPLPLPLHNTLSLGYVRNSLSPQFEQMSAPRWKPEQGVEFNALLTVAPMLLLQPVIQYYANAGGGTHAAVIVGFRTKLDF